MSCEAEQWRVAEQYAAEQYAAERHAAEQHAAEQLAAEQYAAEQYAAEQLAAEQLAAERLAAEQLTAEQQHVAEQRAARMNALNGMLDEIDKDLRRQMDAYAERERRILAAGKTNGDWRFGQHWINMYRMTQAFVDQHGRLPAETEYWADDFAIGAWLKCQRFLHNVLSEDQRAALMYFNNWHWEAGKNNIDRQWWGVCDHVFTYLAIHRALPERSARYNSTCIRRWICDQRRAIRASTMAPERRVVLRQMPVIRWNSYRQRYSAGMPTGGGHNYG